MEYRIRMAGLLAAVLTICLLVPASAASVNGSIQRLQVQIDLQCGANVSEKVVDIERKLSEDMDLVDFGETVADARQIIRIAEPCRNVLKGPCKHLGKTLDCADASWTFMEDAILLSQDDLAYAFGNEGKTSMSLAAIREEFATATVLCSSSHIWDTSPPYDLARLDLKATLRIAGKYSKYSGSPVDGYRNDLRICALRIGSPVKIF